MSRNLRKKRSAWIVIDETGSEGDDNFSCMEDHSDYEDEYQPNKALSKDKIKEKVSVINADKPNCRASTKDKDKASDIKIDLTKTKKEGKERSSKTDVRSETENAIIIDDDDDEDIQMEISDQATNRKRKGESVEVPAKKIRTTEASSSKKKSGIDEQSELYSGAESENKELHDHGNDDSDSVVECPSNRTTDKKYKDNLSASSSYELNRKTNTEYRDIGASTSTAAIEVKKKRFNSRVNMKEENSQETDLTLLSEHEITIDDEDDEDIILQDTKIHRGKNAKIAAASSSKMKVEVDKTDGNRYAVESGIKKLHGDEAEDSDSVVEYQFSRKTERKERDKGSAIIPNKSNHKATNRDKDVKASTSTAVTEVKKERHKSKGDISKSEVLWESDRASISENEITINDEDDEDVELETSHPIKSTSRKKGLADVKRIKKTEASSSKQKSSINKASKDLFAVDSANDKTTEDENKDSDDPVEYQSRKKAVRKDKNQRVEFDKSTKKASVKEKDVTANNSKAVKLLPRSAIVIDDDDDEDIELKTELPAKSVKRKKPNEKAAPKRAKMVKTSSSEERLKVDEEDKTLSTADPEEYKYQKEESNAKGNIDWSESDYLVEFNQIEPRIAENIVSLFKDDNTLPFIARYRKEMTGGMEPEQLRSIKNVYDNIKLIKQRALLILKSIDKLGKWSPEVHSAVSSAKTMHELDLIYAQFKPGTKGSLAERARALGLAPVGEAILRGEAIPDLRSLVDMRREGLRNEIDVRQGIIHIIADKISKDKTTFEGIRKLRNMTVIKIETTRSKSASSSKAKTDEKQKNDHQKYEKYFNFTSSEKLIKGHQILAINRAESQKILTVRTIVPEWFEKNLKDHCLKKYDFVMKISNFYRRILEDSFIDAYSRLIRPLVVRQVRHDLNERAESAAIEVFASNLKKLLLTPPLRGKTVLGIDPGFSHGCKLAVISHCGNVLDTAIIYPHTSSRFKKEQQAEVLIDLVKKHSCTIFALGNATACRETEMFLTELIQAGVFAPLDISYTIVNEAGASIYSCGAEAKAEFPSLDPNIISAISIARRLQDPLAELIKIEPQHLGIGMYQHDLPKKQLQLTLDEVITETVSFVGVDVNTASHCLLRKVAGLSAARAASILTWRDENGPFCNRRQLLKVKGIGKKFFEQCAGFIRILPETALTGNRPQSEEHSLDYLDQTWIHPESYNVARKFLKACGCDPHQIGTNNFIQKVLSYANGNLGMLAKQFGTSETSMDIIINGLSMKKGEDIRVKEEGPLFQKNFRCMDDLSVNTRLTGLVRNVTDFGTFVDIGVEKSGLIPLGKLRGQILSVGQRVEVIVLAIDKNRGRISLSL